MEKQQKIILIIVMSILAISLISAIYSGETLNVSSGLDEIIAWQIVNNISYINVSQINNNSISIKIPEIAEQMNFSIIFKGYKNQQEQIIYVDNPIYYGGGSIVYRNNTIETIKNIPYENTTKINDLNNQIKNLKAKNKIKSILNNPYLLFIVIFLYLLLIFCLFIILKQNNKNPSRTKVQGIFKVTTGNESQQSCGVLDPVETNKLNNIDFNNDTQ